MSEESIFVAALEKPRQPSARPIWRKPAAATSGSAAASRPCCSAHEQSGGLLDPPAVARGRARSTPSSRPPTSPGRLAPADRRGAGHAIGPYKLLRQIGEGGMGVVFLAEQEAPGPAQGGAQGHQAGDGHRAGRRPVRGRAPGAGADGPPNIARVFDAGTTDSGRPFFVMELVNGVPITEYCDRNRLTPERAAGAVRPGLPGDPARPPEGDHPPRHQAVERAGDARRTASRCPR